MLPPRILRSKLLRSRVLTTRRLAAGKLRGAAWSRLPARRREWPNAEGCPPLVLDGGLLSQQLPHHLPSHLRVLLSLGVMRVNGTTVGTVSPPHVVEGEVGAAVSTLLNCLIHPSVPRSAPVVRDFSLAARRPASTHAFDRYSVLHHSCRPSARVICDWSPLLCTIVAGYLLPSDH